MTMFFEQYLGCYFITPFSPTFSYVVAESIAVCQQNSSRRIFVPKLIFFAVLGSIRSKLSENDGVQIFRPLLHFLGVTYFGTPLQTVLHPIFIKVIYEKSLGRFSSYVVQGYYIR